MQRPSSALKLALAALLGLSATPPARADGPPPLEWKDGDRVVLIGDALIEREQKYGYLETLITLHNPDKSITFRNLGWSGDTVRGVARAGFGKPEEGYKLLVQHVLALKPTVLIVGYGMTDSFEGKDGLKAFVEGLDRLLDDLSSLQARTILLSPIKHEDLGRPFPDPKMHNLALDHYSIEIARTAVDRRLHFIDLSGRETYELIELGKKGVPLAVDDERDEGANPEQPDRLTDDGIHPNEFGYWKLGALVAGRLGCGDGGGDDDWSLSIDPYRRAWINARGMTVKWLRRVGPEFSIESTDWVLPTPKPPVKIQEFSGRDLIVPVDLPRGPYALKLDGKVVGKDTLVDPEKRDFERPPLMFDLNHTPEFEQVEQLRQTINEKNRLYFYRWRPQNETYLFGFRKHEQGNNAREVPLFDPLVEEKEEEIARLKVPMPHVYELVREREGEGGK